MTNYELLRRKYSKTDDDLGPFPAYLDLGAELSPELRLSLHDLALLPVNLHKREDLSPERRYTSIYQGKWHAKHAYSYFYHADNGSLNTAPFHHRNWSDFKIPSESHCQLFRDTKY